MWFVSKKILCRVYHLNLDYEEILIEDNIYVHR